MNDKVLLHTSIKEILEYLKILGVNIQKRTQHVIDKKISQKYLDCPDNVKKTAEKINLICDLSKASINKVQEGVKTAIENYYNNTSSTTVDVSNASSNDISTSTLEKCKPEKKNVQKDKKEHRLSSKCSIGRITNLPKRIADCKHRKLKRIKINDNVYISKKIDLKRYLGCSVNIISLPIDHIDKYKAADIDSILSESDMESDTGKCKSRSEESNKQSDVNQNLSSYNKNSSDKRDAKRVKIESGTALANKNEKKNRIEEKIVKSVKTFRRIKFDDSSDSEKESKLFGTSKYSNKTKNADSSPALEQRIESPNIEPEGNDLKNVRREIESENSQSCIETTSKDQSSKLDIKDPCVNHDIQPCELISDPVDHIINSTCNDTVNQNEESLCDETLDRCIQSFCDNLLDQTERSPCDDLFETNQSSTSCTVKEKITEIENRPESQLSNNVSDNVSLINDSRLCNSNTNSSDHVTTQCPNVDNSNNNSDNSDIFNCNTNKRSISDDMIVDSVEDNTTSEILNSNTDKRSISDDTIVDSVKNITNSAIYNSHTDKRSISDDMIVDSVKNIPNSEEHKDSSVDSACVILKTAKQIDSLPNDKEDTICIESESVENSVVFLESEDEKSESVDTSVKCLKSDNNEDEKSLRPSVDKMTNSEQTSNQSDVSKPIIRCVNLSKLLASPKKELIPSEEKNKIKKNKMVTFIDKPTQIIKTKEPSNEAIKTLTKKPSSILLNSKVTYAYETKLPHDEQIIMSSDSESDVSSTTKELLKRIKTNILQGTCNAFVNVTRDAFNSTSYIASLKKYGVTKICSDCDKECSKTKKELNENAKKAVLNSSTSDDNEENESSKNKSKKCDDSLSSTLSSDNELSSKTEINVTRKKKKYSKKRHKKQKGSDSDEEIENLISIPKKRKRKSKNYSSDESDKEGNKQTLDQNSEKTNSSDEMGRSLRLKGRTGVAASPDQSNKDKIESESSTNPLSKENNTSKKTSDSTLLDTMLNEDLKTKIKSGSDAENSSGTGSDSKKAKKSSPTFSEKPISEKIKNDLLEDETSSSARESSPPKVNGKGKTAKDKEESDDESIKEEDSKKEEKDRKVDSDDSDVITKRPSSTIEIDSDDSDDVVRKVKKDKKSQQNGKGSNSDDESNEENVKELSGSESEGSDIFVPTKRKRKQKKASSESSGDNSKESGASKKRRRIKKISGDESSGGSSGTDGEGNKKGRKNIRALKKSSHLDSATRTAARKERERIARIAERQKLYNESLFDESGRPDEVVKLDKVVLDFDPKTKEPTISVDKGLVEKLKPHQANGIKFMWDACFESVKQISETKGSGCILAHCMGLGKTLQVVTLVHTLLTHKETNVERVLVVCPLSTVLNWVNEFNMWLEHARCEDEINIFELSKYKQNYERANQLKDWLECGGVCILGYDMFRNLSADNPKKFRKAQLNAFQQALVDPGPDLVVCDEGHLLKNEKTSISQSMNKVKTLRRIVLTGTPLQNNLKEYYCMVQFVKPNLLGKYNEYLNRFVNPITNGQYTNSTEHDIRVMKRRSHVLHKMLDGAVQRRDYAVLAPFLPPKHEYVLFISLTEIQTKLYGHYLENYSRRPSPDRKTTPSLFADFQSLQRIWTHPLVLKANSERYELMQQKKRDKEEEDDESEGSLADFIDDEEDTTTPEETSASESEDSDDSDQPRKKKDKKKGKNAKHKHKRLTRATAGKVEEDADNDVVEVKSDEPTRLENPTEWWISLCSEDELNDVRHSNKIILLLDILKMCDTIGDKLLVFSQSLYSLDLIEQFLAKIDDATQKNSSDDHLAGHVGSWAQGLDYFRLDGSTSCENRELWCKAFNREDNPRARLFLISTRAGGLGINLVAANRVVIFDMSWNPSHDVQSIFRVYRFGQKKPCYIYRFLALGTMEEKIYERQVTKQAISKRVIDEQQIDRHYTENDLAELYMFCPVPEGQREVPKLPKDRLFADLLQQHDTMIYKYHEHDSLLENKEEETLTEEERKAAWEDYENEKTRPPPTLGAGTNWLLNMQQQQQQQQMTINALSAVLRQDYPTMSDQQIATMIPSILQQMYANGDTALLQKMNAMMTAQTNMMGTPNAMLGGYKYPQNMLQPGMMMNPAMGIGGMTQGVSPMYQQSWQQMQMQRLQQQQALQTNLKYYAGGLGSRDLMDMAALQQQQRALLLGHKSNGPKTVPLRQQPQEVVDLDSE